MDESGLPTTSVEQAQADLAQAILNSVLEEIYRTSRKALEAFSLVIRAGSLPSSTPKAEKATASEQ